MTDESGIHLVRTDENGADIDAWTATETARGGARVGLAGVLAGLESGGAPGGRRARRTLAPGRAVHRALTWDRADRRDRLWWPQGITTSADGYGDERFEGRRVVLVSWYARGRPGVRISVLDLDTRRYAHVLVVEPTRRGRDDRDHVAAAPLRAHAGGIVWHHEWLHVAATARGLHTCRLDDVVRLAEPVDGCHYALPVRFEYAARTGPGQERLRYSFLSLDRAGDPPHLVVGEYGHSDQTRRLARYPVDPATRYLLEDDAGRVAPLLETGDGAVNAQGAVIARGRWYVTVSRTSSKLGSVYAGEPGALRRFRWATPMGPEDLAYWPSTDLLWSVTEHPHRRWVFSMRRSRFG